MKITKTENGKFIIDGENRTAINLPKDLNIPVYEWMDERIDLDIELITGFTFIGNKNS